MQFASGDVFGNNNPKAFLHLYIHRIPLQKFRSIRRTLSDSGRAVEELVAGSVPLKYNLGFPSSNGPTPETLKNYLDVSIVSCPLTSFLSEVCFLSHISPVALLTAKCQLVIFQIPIFSWACFGKELLIIVHNSVVTQLHKEPRSSVTLTTEVAQACNPRR